MRAKKEVDTWKAKCDKAERALDNAVKRFNEAPDDATQEELDAIRKKLNAAQGKLQELYFDLPYSLDDVAGEFYAKLRVEEMVAEGEVTPKKRKRITADQVAEVVNRYLSMQHGLVIVDHAHRYNRHEWEIQATAGYSAPHEHIPAHNDLLGRIWVDVLTEEGQVSGWRMGYGVARDELELGDKFRMATEFRGAYRAVEKEFDGLEEPEDKPTKKEPYTLPTSRPGRRQFYQYKWARRKIAEGHDVEELYWEWLEQYGHQDDSNLRRNFRKAMRYKLKT